MAKRCNMAIENNWPKRAELRRFHDRVLRWLEKDHSIVDYYHPFTPLHLPDHVFIDQDLAYSTLLGSIFRHGLEAFVYAQARDSVRIAIQIGSKY